MRLGKNTKRYIRASVDSIVPIISSVKPTKEINDSLIKKILGEPEDPIAPAPLTRDEKFAMKMFYDFAEIHGCIERLKDCETYIARFPFSRTRITRAAYLQLVVETHLHELYLLRERLVKNAKTIARLYRKDPGGKHIAKVSDALEKFVATVLGGFTRVRGAHVHERRYAHDDIDRLQLIAILRKGPNSPLNQSLRGIQILAAEESHTRLKTQALKWNRRAAQTLEQYCGVVLPIVFSEDGKSFKYPRVRREIRGTSI